VTSLVLKPAELLYRGVNRLRRTLYRAGILKARRLPVPVISVGGIAAGGSGKTPAVIAIAGALEARGFRVAVLTRGYGRAGTGGVVTSLDATRFGDEPVLIKKRLPNVDVIVGSNRYQNALGLSNTVFVLDDAFQHLQLHRDLDVVIDHARSSFLREGRAALRHAQVVLPRNLRMTIPQSVREKRVFAFAGLADNEQFFESLRAAGLNVTGTRSFGDHHPYIAAEVEEIKRAAADAGAEAIVTTEKDAVKIDDPAIIAIAADLIIAPQEMERILAAAVRR
jgi:tetraacyldisaccharide 4'-kinase